VRLARVHARAFRRAVGAVAREERYLAIVRPFPLPQVKTFVAECVRKKRPTFVAVAEERLVGGCDVAEKPRPLLAHEKFGFVVERLCRRHMRLRGRYYDSYPMALLFD